MHYIVYLFNKITNRLKFTSKPSYPSNNLIIFGLIINKGIDMINIKINKIKQKKFFFSIIYDILNIIILLEINLTILKYKDIISKIIII